MTKPHMTIVAGTLIAAVVLAACSSGGAETPSSSTTEAADTTETTSTAVVADTTTTTTTTTVAEPAIKGADPIEQTTTPSGGGDRPLLEWEPIQGAVTYIVSVFTETGAPYWSAVTTEPRTYVGGAEQIAEGRTGPNVSEGYTWIVYADDADGNLLATSPQRAIAP